MARTLSDTWKATCASGETMELFKQYVEILLTDDLKAFIALTLGIFTFFVGLQLLILENFAQSLKKEPSILFAFGSFDLVISIALPQLAGKYLGGFEAPLTQFHIVLESIRDTANYASASGMHDVHIILIYMVHLCEGAIRPGGPLSSVQPPTMCAASEQRMGIDASDYPRRFRICTGLLYQLLLKTGPSTDIARAVTVSHQRTIDYMNQHERARAITPPFFSQVFFTLLLFVFMIKTTVTVWLYVGPVTTLLVYPAMLTFLALLVVHQMWLLSPWSPMRPWKAGNHEEWPQEFMNDITSMFYHSSGNPAGNIPPKVAMGISKPAFENTKFA